MPFENEVATGESLLALEKSLALKEFEGSVAVRPANAERDPAPLVEVARSDWLPSRVIAIDGSSITHKVRNGFPGAECSLVMLSVVFIDISKLAAIGNGQIPSPRIFNEMDSAHTLDAVLPGSNVVRQNVEETSKTFFRASVYEALHGKLDKNHETLLETMRAIVTSRTSNIRCPIEDCEQRYGEGKDIYTCTCDKGETLFETDALRFHERFNELGSNGEVHGEVRHVLEVLALVNVLRFFEDPKRIHFLKDCAFVLDGPLAVFGQPAWLAPWIRAEIIRISAAVRKATGGDLLVIGLEKTGQYVTHFADLDWTDKAGPRSKFSAGSVLIPDARYVNRNIVFRPEDAKPSGADTYFGRKVFYKTRNEAHAVLNMAMVNTEGADFYDCSAAAFPRLGDALNVLDHLSTYLYQDGFMPLVRAHAHAAIPLKRGTDIIMGLFGEA